MPIDPRDKFFPNAPTLADYEAAVKRATDAEDHLAREVASSQALQAENSTLRTEALARDAIVADLLTQVDHLKETIAAHEQTLEAWSVAKSRDNAFIGNLRKELVNYAATIAAQAEQLATLLAEPRTEPAEDLTE